MFPRGNKQSRICKLLGVWLLVAGIVYVFRWKRNHQFIGTTVTTKISPTFPTGISRVNDPNVIHGMKFDYAKEVQHLRNTTKVALIKASRKLRKLTVKLILLLCLNSYNIL